MNRTVPSVSSLLGCQADILQLDVMYLFDDFHAGGNFEDYLRHLELERTANLEQKESSEYQVSLSNIEIKKNVTFMGR
jgi:hypothetical protein